MKPKDLILPPKKEKEVICDLSQKIFYAPSRTDRKARDFCLDQIFENKRPIHLEYCSGNGDWICQKAKSHPQFNWIALEMRFDRIRKIWSKMNNQKISNLFIVCAEALDFTQHYLPEGSIEQLYVHFPDPWPKRKHAKNRLIQPPFLDEAARVLSETGQMHTLTDDEAYFRQIATHFLDHKSFISLIPAPYYTPPCDDYGSSFFMNLWKEKKRTFYFSKFSKSVHKN